MCFVQLSCVFFDDWNTAMIKVFKYKPTYTYQALLIPVVQFKYCCGSFIFPYVTWLITLAYIQSKKFFHFVYLSLHSFWIWQYLPFMIAVMCHTWLAYMHIELRLLFSMHLKQDITARCHKQSSLVSDQVKHCIFMC